AQFAMPVALQFVDKFSRLTIPDFDDALSLCGGHAAAVGTVCQIQRLTPSFFQGRSRFSRRKIPNTHRALRAIEGEMSAIRTEDDFSKSGFPFQFECLLAAGNVPDVNQSRILLFLKITDRQSLPRAL